MTETYVSALIGKDLAASLINAQHSIGKVMRGKENDFFSSKYADITAIWEKVQPALEESGLACLLFPQENTILCTIVHVSGQIMERVCGLPPAGKAGPQPYVAAVTYGRRCILGAVFGIVFQDDDGNSIQKSHDDAAKAEKSDAWSKSIKTKLFLIFDQTRTSVALKHEWEKNAEDIARCTPEVQKEIQTEYVRILGLIQAKENNDV